jgi:peptidyl-dipeptidase Dcp
MIACKNKPASNPFFESWTTPYEIAPFDRITLSDYREAFLKGLDEQTAEIEAIVNNPELPTFDNTLVALDASGELLNRVAGVFFSESSANGTKEILALESELVPPLTQHGDRIWMNARLFDRVKYVQEHTDSALVAPEDYRLLRETYLRFVRNGVNLPEAEAEELRRTNEQLSVLENKFGQNVLNETGAYQLFVADSADLSGLSEPLLASAAHRAQAAGTSEEGKGRWLFGLDNPSIMPFLAAADNRDLRNQLLTAYLNRCNNDNEYDNKAVLKEILVLRNKKAQLLHYANYAEYVLERRMARNSQNVYRLLDKIWAPGLKKAQEELAAMQPLVGQGSALAAADWRYYAEKLKAARYELSEDDLRPYFQASNVVDGLFWVTNRLYGVTFRERTDLPKPNGDVRTFVCVDRDGSTELGVLFIDLYARPGLKTVGAWCGTYRDAHRDAAGQRVLPLTYVCCNFPAPIGDRPSLLTSDDAETFFHEMGHAMNNLFQDVKYHATGSVPSDFVELPSQFMEHWVFQPQVLAQYAKHYQTGETIPADLVDKIQASAKYGQGFATTEYMAASYLDLDYHVYPSPETIDVTQFEATTLSRRGLIPQIPPRYRSTYFKHTFEGGYSAGYYSYIWSEVLDCDAFEAFIEAGDLFNQEIAERFRRTILEPGGIFPADELYLRFRGRQPDVNALLRNRGLE